ncbi:MAG TPA: MotA/TolQ/ExbB proton channel family protein [Gammaproteobacteria bacterium]|jgi:biopolymer transport protein ExbB|nr:MotA/TolQ/ExbB proton channel family protein [Xanthomonadales bacterium]HOP22764.1 MotA/TolQ/ExbB proton channel family protein [Gammaproteobacteria bacterium]HPI96621.1 MotA/TolQ/ExbB proton channel family protein [Gammaproteobacteria bacterium]
MKIAKIMTLAAFLFSVSSLAIADESLSMDDLLNKVKAGRAADNQDNKRREQEFIQQKQEQERMIREAKAEIAALESKSAEMEKQFNENELAVEEKRKQRDERLGSLKELFGHLTSTAGALRETFKGSLTSTQFPGRVEFLDTLIKKMNSSTDLPSMEEIEKVWFEMHREITESGRVVKYNTKVGTQGSQEVVRVGLFNLVSNGNYLSYEPDTGNLSVLARQPEDYQAGAAAFQSSTSGVSPLGIDPTGPAGGGYLSALINSPTIEERWHQGKLVGYIITGIAVFGILLAIWRFIVLSGISAKVNKQLKSKELSNNNPLGRVLSAAEAHHNTDIETLELRLGEAILKEKPAINKGIPLLKIISMVAPLLGLLGTVTGMIIVFQAITIFGAGDPKAMAGGISSALVTTVLGLVAAIPTLLLHTFLSGKAKGIMHILEEQSAGILAERSEQK